MFICILSNCKVFNVLPGTEDVILVQGCASDGSGNGDTYCGPCYVPKTVTALKFDVSTHTDVQIACYLLATGKSKAL